VLYLFGDLGYEKDIKVTVRPIFESGSACGLAGGTDLPSSVFPFIFRSVSLLGIDTVRCLTALQSRAWSRLAHELTEADFADVATELGLEELESQAGKILVRQVRGRTVVNPTKAVSAAA